MNMKTQQILDEFYTEKNLTISSRRLYNNAIKHYEELNQMTLHELLSEADEEEEAGIRWKHRRLRKRLTQYQNWLLQNYNYSTATNYLGRVKTIYYYNQIEIHKLPTINKRQATLSEPITYNDLPTKTILRKAYKIANPVMRALILFNISSGCGKQETLNFTKQDYYKWIDPYTPKELLEEHIDIVPTINTRRVKTNHYYTTFASPEAIREIATYLQTRHDDKPQLFKIEYKYMSELFQQYNDKLGLGRKNNMNHLRSHMLRKFHATQLSTGKYPLSLDEIDSLQGRVKYNSRKSYYFDDPEYLRKKYIQNIDQVTILDEVHTITVDSPEVQKLKEKADKIDELEKLVKKIMEKNQQ